MAPITMLAYEAEIEKIPTFKLMPVSIDCPFSEAVYDVTEKRLIVFSKERLPNFLQKPVYNEKGKVIRMSDVLSETPYQYVITKKEDIETFIKHHVINNKHESLKILEI